MKSQLTYIWSYLRKLLQKALTKRIRNFTSYILVHEKININCYSDIKVMYSIFDDHIVLRWKFQFSTHFEVLYCFFCENLFLLYIDEYILNNAPYSIYFKFSTVWFLLNENNMDIKYFIMLFSTQDFRYLFLKLYCILFCKQNLYSCDIMVSKTISLNWNFCKP